MATVEPRRLLAASPRAFCAGVERAIEIVERLLEKRKGPVFVRKQIVHNTHVVAALEAKGAVFVHELDDIPDGATVVFSAHGVSPAVRDEAARRALEVVDATCPLVSKVHAEAHRLVRDGYQVVLIGHAGHEEVEGTLGHAAPGQMQLAETPEDVADIVIRPPGKVAYLTQTTLAVDEAADVVDVLRAKYPHLVDPPSDDICYATTNRQQAIRAVAAESDVVLVVGSANSSNSVRLVEVAQRAGTQAYLVDDATHIRPEWLDGVSTIGVTAGASAPQSLVAEVIDAIRRLGPIEVAEHETTSENVIFGLPPQVR
ncbi:4-hydroxy-3-methylbut-2-enyl diphosphate reductase [Amycolatopsis sp. NPDC049868]|uniref:4-hydroxy-3-methylbut-2-enyl diphosphate reductase n=1 Tax=Amycolatopsis sp. NPDC049868 TaxID=3363934 RepID=UPI0037A31DFC